MTAGKVALVTGAGTGVGKSAALALMKDGFALVLSGRRKAPLDAVVAEGKSMGAKVIAVVCDVSDPSSVKAMFAETMRIFGRLDVLFNNAGTGTPAIPLEDLPVEKWLATLATNLTGAFLCTQEAFRIMKAQTPRGGRIINNGSISAHTPRPFSAPYTATKHGITGLTKSAALDGRAYNIACGQIDIGNAATEMTERMTQGVLQPDGSTKVEPRMEVTHVGEAVAAMARLPLEVNIQFMTIMATKMPFIGRG
jgi:NAD(P)-dependent dehydrogenase (short-subunit alcohol dehydrogenase family)